MSDDDFLTYTEAVKTLKATPGWEITRTWLKEGYLTVYRRPITPRSNNEHTLASHVIVMAAELDDRDGLIKLIRGPNIRKKVKDQYGLDLK